jgi:putative toxin-antitoxin system antitoxin component (TIGR02293 family)
LEIFPNFTEIFPTSHDVMATTTLIKDASKTTHLLAKYESFFRDNISLLQKAKKGLPARAVFDLIAISRLPDDIIESALNKTMKSFQNYVSRNIALDTPTSEKLLKLFALYNKGTEVFGSLDAFRQWLTRPAYGLGDQVPLNIFDTITGVDLISEELTRIEYGDLA